jgi:hypothetical protein
MWLAVQNIRCLWRKSEREIEHARHRNQAPLRQPLTGLEACLAQPMPPRRVLWQEIMLGPEGEPYDSQPAIWRPCNRQQLRQYGYSLQAGNDEASIGVEYWHGAASRHTGQAQLLGVLRPGQWLRVVTHHRANGWDYWAWERRVTNLLCVDRLRSLDFFASTPPLRELNEEPHLY